MNYINIEDMDKKKKYETTKFKNIANGTPFVYNGYLYVKSKELGQHPRVNAFCFEHYKAFLFEDDEEVQVVELLNISYRRKEIK